MRLLGIDIETGDFDTENTFITEVAAVLWDTEIGQPVKIFSALIDEEKEISKEAEEYTGISNFMRQTYGIPLEAVEPNLKQLAVQSEYLVAHNGLVFDKPIVERKFKSLVGYKWIDTLIDIEYPNNCKSKNLTYLQAFHGFVNPFPHRAVADVLTMFKILNQYSFPRILAVANSPEIEIVARFEYPHRMHPQHAQLMEIFNKTKDKVKEAGFKWYPEEKRWKLKTKKCIADKLKFEFPVFIKEEEF
jgi:DNA polymerase-3 subunit epsilon